MQFWSYWVFDGENDVTKLQLSDILNEFIAIFKLFFVAVYIVRKIGFVNNFKSKTFTFKRITTIYTHTSSREMKAEEALYSKLYTLYNWK